MFYRNRREAANFFEVFRCEEAENCVHFSIGRGRKIKTLGSLLNSVSNGVLILSPNLALGP